MEFPRLRKKKDSGRVVNGTKPGPVHYLNNTEEKELEEYLIQANKVGYGKTRCQVKVIADKVAIAKGVLRGAQISDRYMSVENDCNIRVVSLSTTTS